MRWENFAAENVSIRFDDESGGREGCNARKKRDTLGHMEV